MSYVLFGDDVIFSQRLLKSQGFYEGDLDGQWGAETELAAVIFEDGTVEIREKYGAFDTRTSRDVNRP